MLDGVAAALLVRLAHALPVLLHKVDRLPELVVSARLAPLARARRVGPQLAPDLEELGGALIEEHLLARILLQVGWVRVGSGGCEGRA